MKAETKIKVLVINCSPVRNGATAEIVNIVTARLEKKPVVKFHLKMGFAEANRIICFTKRLTDLEE